MEKTMIDITRSNNMSDRVFNDKTSKLSDTRIKFGFKIVFLGMRILGYSKNDIRDMIREETGEDYIK